MGKEFDYKRGKVKGYSAGEAILMAVGGVLLWIGANIGSAWAKDKYNEHKEKKKEEKRKEEETKRVEADKELRPWYYYESPRRGTVGSGLPNNVKTPLWGYGIYEGYLFNLFAPTDVGKTTLALQIVNELAYNESSTLIPNWPIGRGRRILYFDEEYNLEHFPLELKKFYESQEKQRVEFYNRSGSVDKLLDRIYGLVKARTAPTIVFIDNTVSLCHYNPAKERCLIEGIWKLLDYFREKAEPRIPLTIVLIGHTLKQKKNEGLAQSSEGNLEGVSEQTSRTTGMIELGKTHEPGYFRLAFPKNKALPKSENVYIIHRVDALNFEFVCEMTEKEALDKKTKFERNAEGRQSLVERAKSLASKEGEDEFKKLKAELGSEDLYANMPEEQKAELVALAKTLVNQGYSSRLTSAIILLEKGKYISHDAISKCCKG